MATVARSSKRGSKPGERRGGRKKGTPNKVTASIKQAITEAFEELGGVASLVEWGEENPTEFYKLWGRLAPQEMAVTGSEGGPVEFKVRFIRERAGKAQ